METVLQWVGIVGVITALIVAFAVWLWKILVTFDYWGKRNTLGIERETLGLPKGAIKTFLMLTFTSVALYAPLSPNVVSPGDKNGYWPSKLALNP